MHFRVEVTTQILIENRPSWVQRKLNSQMCWLPESPSQKHGQIPTPPRAQSPGENVEYKCFYDCAGWHKALLHRL